MTERRAEKDRARASERERGAGGKRVNECVCVFERGRETERERGREEEGGREAEKERLGVSLFT